MKPSSRAVPPGRPAPVRSRPGRVTSGPVRRPPHRLPTLTVEPEPGHEPEPEPQPPGPEPRRSRRRRLIVVLVVAGVVVLLLECVAIARMLRSDDPDSEPPPRAVGLPLVAPDALPERGSLVQSEVRRDGTVRVSQWLRSGDGIDELLLAAPTPAGSAGPIRATGVRLVAADGTVIVDALTIGAEPRLVRFPDSTTMARATYVLRGAVEASGTVDGRVRALVVSLDVDRSLLAGPTVAVVAAQTSGEVLGVGCGNVRSSVDLVRPCGTPDGSSWRVRLPAASREDRLTAVVDLP